MSILNPEIIQLSSTALVSIIALWAIVQLFREKKKNGNGKKEYWEIMEKINAFEKNLDTNHFDSLERRLDNQDGKLDRIIVVLTEIKTILDKQK